MKMKRISAVTVKDAMALARRELGDDAVLIDSKKDPSGGGVIVTFAIDKADEPLFDDPITDAEMVVPFTPAMHKPTIAKVELDHPAHEIIHQALAYHSVPPTLNDRLMDHVHRVALKPDSLINVAENALAQALTANVRFNSIGTAAKKPPTRAIMLVGQHGAGKTSTIAKMATELTLHKQPVHLITTDTERLGGAESLELLAKLLKCDFTISDSRMHLKTLVASLQGKAWVLIDSSGANIYEFSQLKMLGEFASLQGIEPILTCAAGMDSAEAVEMASVFNFINIERMIVTRIDAVRRLGSVFSALTTGGYALANYTNSALPTDTCQPLSAATLARLMLRHIRAQTTN
jgi:flagellar biosynthesis protein FlhF